MKSPSLLFLVLMFLGSSFPLRSFGNSYSFSEVVAEIKTISLNRKTADRKIQVWAKNSISPSGFIQLGYVDKTKLGTARKLQKFIHDAYGYNFLLAPSLGKVDVPGYDGVILDANFRPLANVSLKSAGQPKFGSIFIRSQAAFSKMDSYSEPESLAAFGLVRKPEDRREEITPFELNHFSAVKNVVVTMAAIFGPGTDRKRLLVFDIEDSSLLDDEDIRSLASLSRYDENHHQIMFMPEKVVTYSGGKLRVEDSERPALSCSKLLQAGNAAE